MLQWLSPRLLLLSAMCLCCVIVTSSVTVHVSLGDDTQHKSVYVRLKNIPQKPMYMYIMDISLV